MAGIRGAKHGSAAAWFAVVSAILVSCAGGDDVLIDDDAESPAAVMDLVVRAVTPTSVILAWTAPGDRGAVGTAAEYDVRVSKAEITWQNWSAATPLSGEPVPHAAGTVDTMVVAGLEEDSTYYFALMTRNHQDMWSRVSNCASATCFDNFVVTFADAALEAAVRVAIPKATGEIRRLDAMKVRFVDAQNMGITSLDGLQHCIHLETLFITGNTVGDLSPLSGLAGLRSLQASNNQVADLGPLADLVLMEQLILRNNQVSDIAALAGLTALADVHLGENAVTDISALAAMTQLRSLDVSVNDVTEVTPLGALVALEYLNLYDNDIADISPLASLGSLAVLNLWSNEVVDVSALAGLGALTNLLLGGNHIVDIAPLVANAGLGEGDIVYLVGNPLSPVSLGTHVPALVARGVTVNL